VRAISGILPRMTIEDALDVTRIYSVADRLPPDVPLIHSWPFRSPHHTISRVQGTLTFPANFMMISAMNRCPCGYYGLHVIHKRTLPGLRK
jgi:magnesium chelatase family protein